MMEKKFTEEEAKLYDRQIRLWGLDAQKRLRSSRILISGVGGLGCEVAKNLVLAGIKSLKMIDTKNLTKEDGHANFLASRDDIGKNRAVASLQRVQNLNPMVEVTAEELDVESQPKEFFKQFDIVLVTQATNKDILVKVNAICRDLDIKFLAGDIFGMFGYAFMDLVEHEFVEEVPKTAADSSEDVDLESEPKAKKAKTSEDGDAKKPDDSTTKVVKNVMKFVSLEKSLNADWNSDVYKKRIRRMDPSFFLLHVLYEFQSREGRSPALAHEESDLKLLADLAESIKEKFGLPEAKISPDFFPALFGETSPVAAIVGGIQAQEIIKIISNKDAPHNNFFLFNPLETAGVVEAVGY